MKPGDPCSRGADEQSTTELLAEAGSPVHARVQAFWEGGTAALWLGPRAEVLVGRGSDCDLRIVHSSVSRRHARLQGGDPAHVEDLDSANGVCVRGVRIPARTPVAVSTGDVIAIGSALVVVQQPVYKAAARVDHPHAAAPLAAEGPMRAIVRLIDLVAPSDLSVLLLGETGVGKTMAAASIHDRSSRAGKPFVRIHCPSFPEALLESELFGHEKGAFTGAAQSKAGLIESADGGTVFLDEIGELPLATQAKLLSIVDTRELLRLGSLEPRHIDVRFVAATNRDLEAQVANGSFRQDLYFRLNGISIVIPPLRERVDEIPTLARQFVVEAAQRAGRRAPQLSDATLSLLASMPWPGNVREVRTIMERAVVLCPGAVLHPEDIATLATGSPTPSAPTPAPATPSTLREQLDAVERERIERALESCGGNQSRVAKALGISRRTLIRRMEAYGMARPRKRVS